jgi:hypothetical protein
MKRILEIISILILNLACSNNIRLSNRYFESGDSNKLNSFAFINDTICIYKQEFLFDMPDDYKAAIIKCNYSVENNNVILKNLSKNKDSLKMTCFRIPEEVLSTIGFFQPDTLKSKYIYLGAPPTISRIDLYGYIDNITIDTMTIKRRSIVYDKRNKCCNYYFWISQKFKEVKQFK